MTHQITFAPSGHHCPAADSDTILQAALNAGFLLPYNCRNGTCGACKGKLLSGQVDPGKTTASVLLPAEIDAGEVLFCCAKPLTDITVQSRDFQATNDIQVKRLPCRVARLYKAAPDVMVLVLELPHGKRLPFLAGQHIDILLSDGSRRAFSIASAPHEEDALELHIRHVPGGRFTGHVFTDMRVRDPLRIEGPHGNFFLRESSASAATEPPAPLILVAGGTGFAPLKSMLLHAIHQGLTRPIWLYWGARQPQGLYMHELAQEWADHHPNIRYVPVVSDPSPQYPWTGRTGPVHQAVLEDWPDLSACEVYVCGSDPMKAAAWQALAPRGLRASHFYGGDFSETLADATCVVS